MEPARHVMIVDDDAEIRQMLHEFLVKSGYRVSTAQDGREMNRIMAQWPIDLVVLDVLLPGEDGHSLCRQLRTHSNVPVIMLTAMSSELDRVVGLEVGADDYLVKPFSPRELLARIRAVLRRVAAPKPPAAPKVMSFAGWTLHQGRRELRTADNVVVHLSGGEYDLLCTFLERPQQVIERWELLEKHRGNTALPFDRSLDILISRLRRKLDAGGTELIKTVRGVGYQFAAAVFSADESSLPRNGRVS
jgi:two-component system OmpR family response regulator